MPHSERTFKPYTVVSVSGQGEIQGDEEQVEPDTTNNLRFACKLVQASLVNLRTLKQQICDDASPRNTFFQQFGVGRAAVRSRNVQVFERVGGSFRHVVVFPLIRNC